MWKPSTDRKISLAFFAAFALLAVVPLFVFENRGRLLEDSGWVAHTQEVIAGLESTALALVDAESGQRGYVITGREEYLEHYSEAVTAVTDRLAELARLTLDNQAQQERLERLKPLVRERTARLQEAIEARRSKTYLTAAAIIGSDEGRRIMNDIRTCIAEMHAEENRLLAVRQQILKTSVSKGMTVFWIVTTLNFLTLGFSFYLVNRYIKHRRSAEQWLSEAKQAAEQANISKSAFLANMSHEIRTPMTAIVGYADMLLEPGSTRSDQLECLQTIRRNARHLLELINDVLDLSKIEAGKMSAESLKVDLPQLTSDVVSMMRPRAVEKGLGFRLHFDGLIPRAVQTDALRLKQILVNLLGNAIKFTEKGSVDLHVSCTLAEGQNAVVRFDVTDTGLGISQQQIDRLFQSFSQADESTTRRFGGSGLGLTISQRLARILGGALTVRSEPLRGSTFTLTIDAGSIEQNELINGINEAALNVPAPVEAAATPVAALKARILLVEDGVDNQRLISTYLRGVGAEVVIADNGKVAVDLVAQQRFDLIVMDMQMPEMDGYAAATVLRRQGLTLPIIALTAHAMADDRAKCLDAGCTDYLTKPIAKRDLLAAVRSHLPAESTTLRSTFANESDMREIIDQFIAGLPEQVEQLKTLLEMNDKHELRRLVHQIKGSGGGYGFQPITDAAVRAERQILENADSDDLDKGIRDLIGIISSVEGFRPTHRQPQESV